MSLSNETPVPAAEGSAGAHRIPIACMRPLYQLDAVNQRLVKLPAQEHEHLRTTYERMLERGPERFQVKPSGLPAMDRLYEATAPRLLGVIARLVGRGALAEDLLQDVYVRIWKAAGQYRPGAGFDRGDGRFVRQRHSSLRRQVTRLH